MARSRVPPLLDGPTHRIQTDLGHRVHESDRRTRRQSERHAPGEPLPPDAHSRSPTRPRDSVVAVVEPVVLGEEVSSVVVAVGCPHDGVDVEAGGLRIGEEDTWVVVVLDQHYG